MRQNLQQLAVRIWGFHSSPTSVMKELIYLGILGKGDVYLVDFGKLSLVQLLVVYFGRI